MRTVGDLSKFAVQQEEALRSCESKREGLVGIIDATTVQEPWWKLW